VAINGSSDEIQRVSWENSAPLYTLSATVPTGALASVVVWGLKDNGAVGNVLESGMVLWANGTYVPGVDGVVSAQVGPEAESIIVQVMGGSYFFSVLP
jgi:hypothetical protein